MTAIRPIRERIEESSIPEPNSGCWIWLLAVREGRGEHSRYGRMKIGGLRGKAASAHRVSYEEYKGPIPAGLEVMHKCDNIVCVNPDHLEVGTHLENMQDMHRKGRHRRPYTRNPKAVKP